jgi:hypothetical protein
MSAPHALIDQFAHVRPVRVNIIGKSNGVGLARDLELLERALQQPGLEVTVTPIDANQARRRRSAWTQLLTRLSFIWRGARASDMADINIMLEHVWLQYLGHGRLNIAVPNPEWFDSHDLRFLGSVDRVWTKTGYTDELFKGLGCSTTYIGFDSYDRIDP